MKRNTGTLDQASDVRKGELRQLGNKIRGILEAEKRQAGEDEQAEEACETLARVCGAICSAALGYSWGVAGVVTEEIYMALVDCAMCCDLHVSLMCRESELDDTSAELCAAACRALVEACTGLTDPMMEACSKAATQCAEACDGMAAAGEAEEPRGVQEPLEIRSVKCELRNAAVEGKPSRITGYPIVFNELSEQLSEDGIKFRENIQPGAIVFDKDVKADFDHDSARILGRVKVGTLALSIDERGVKMEATPPDAQWARDLMASIDRGDIDQGSFAFKVLPGGESWEQRDGQNIRNLSRILVRRVSVVSDPAYTATSVQVRSVKIGQPSPASVSPDPEVEVEARRQKVRLALAS